MSSKTKRRARKRGRVPPTSRPHATPRPRPVVAPRPRRGTPAARRAALTATPRRLYAYAVGLAALTAAVLIGLSVFSANRSTASKPPVASGVAGGAATAALLGGIPQHGAVLGSAKAPLRLIEYADPQCPYCAVYARDVLPTLIQDYVRTGKVQLVFHGLGFLGADSGTALRTATAAAAQNRFWNVLELLYRNQGAENAWVTDQLLRSIATAAGADAGQVFAARDGAAVNATIAGWARQAQADGVNAVPMFFTARRGAQQQRLAVSALTVASFRAAIDQALQG